MMELSIDQKLSRRLIVLITDSQVNNRDLVDTIQSMAICENLSILYLVLVDDKEKMSIVSRHIATMKAMTSANSVVVEAKLIEADNWLEMLCKLTNPGDIIICQEEQEVLNDLFKTNPINDFLSSHINSPVRTISGFYSPLQTHTRRWFHELFNLFGFLAIIAVFTWLQISLDQALDGPLAKICVMVAFCLEMAAVWIWYKFTNR